MDRDYTAYGAPVMITPSANCMTWRAATWLMLWWSAVAGPAQRRADAWTGTPQRAAVRHRGAAHRGHPRKPRVPQRDGTDPAELLGSRASSSAATTAWSCARPLWRRPAATRSLPGHAAGGAARPPGNCCWRPEWSASCRSFRDSVRCGAQRLQLPLL